MLLCYFPARQQFAFVLGDSPSTAQLIRMIGADMFFNSRKDAVEAAAFCGLTVARSGYVSRESEAS